MAKCISVGMLSSLLRAMVMMLDVDRSDWICALCERDAR